MKLNLFVTALISAAFTHGVSAFYLAEEEYDALSQIDVLTDLDADLDADIDADLDADLDADAEMFGFNKPNYIKKKKTGAASTVAGAIAKGPPRTAAKTADIIAAGPPKKSGAASTVAGAIAAGPPKKSGAASTVAAAIAKGPPKPTTAAQISGETTEGGDALVRTKAHRLTPKGARENSGIEEEDTGMVRVKAQRKTPK